MLPPLLPVVFSGWCAFVLRNIVEVLTAGCSARVVEANSCLRARSDGTEGATWRSHDVKVCPSGRAARLLAGPFDLGHAATCVAHDYCIELIDDLDVVVDRDASLAHVDKRRTSKRR